MKLVFEFAKIRQQWRFQDSTRQAHLFHMPTVCFHVLKLNFFKYVRKKITDPQVQHCRLRTCFVRHSIPLLYKDINEHENTTKTNRICYKNTNKSRIKLLYVDYQSRAQENSHVGLFTLLFMKFFWRQNSNELTQEFGPK